MKNIKFIVFIFYTVTLVCQENLKWYSLKEAIELNKKQPKKILIDMYTDWCGWCKKMERETFQHPAIARYIREHFYPVKFNAETRDTIEFKGEKYVNTSIIPRTPHSLALKLMNNRASYPTIVYLDEELNLLSAVPGYMTPADIEPILIFFARNIYKIYPFDNFKKDFLSTFKDTMNIKNNVKFINFKKLSVSNKKKIIFLYHKECIECNIMLKTIIQHDTISAYLNKYFDCVIFDITSTDTITFNGLKYATQKGVPFHQLALALTNGNINLPQLVFLSETNQLISLVPGYFPHKMFEILIHFFNEEAYHKQSWEEYVKNFKSNTF
ncbi:MAG: thioredoxin fold domain-containing protein [Bacteroidales bacterium]|nr:thioredoxin fold domain-containing protein [Bacteroidales bacterium]